MTEICILRQKIKILRSIFGACNAMKMEMFRFYFNLFNFVFTQNIRERDIIRQFSMNTCSLETFTTHMNAFGHENVFDTDGVYAPSNFIEFTYLYPSRTLLLNLYMTDNNSFIEALRELRISRELVDGNKFTGYEHSRPGIKYDNNSGYGGTFNDILYVGSTIIFHDPTEHTLDVDKIIISTIQKLKLFYDDDFKRVYTSSENTSTFIRGDHERLVFFIRPAHVVSSIIFESSSSAAIVKTMPRFYRLCALYYRVGVAVDLAETKIFINTVFKNLQKLLMRDRAPNEVYITSGIRITCTYGFSNLCICPTIENETSDFFTKTIGSRVARSLLELELETGGRRKLVYVYSKSLSSAGVVHLTDKFIVRNVNHFVLRGLKIYIVYTPVLAEAGHLLERMDECVTNDTVVLLYCPLASDVTVADDDENDDDKSVFWVTLKSRRYTSLNVDKCNLITGRFPRSASESHTQSAFEYKIVRPKNTLPPVTLKSVIVPVYEGGVLFSLAAFPLAYVELGTVFDEGWLFTCLFRGTPIGEIQILGCFSMRALFSSSNRLKNVKLDSKKMCCSFFNTHTSVTLDRLISAIKSYPSTLDVNIKQVYLVHGFCIVKIQILNSPGFLYCVVRAFNSPNNVNDDNLESVDVLDSIDKVPFAALSAVRIWFSQDE